MSAVNSGVGAAPVSPADDLEFLKAQAKAMGEQLRAANTSIAGLKAEVPASGLVAMVDREKCIACGVCEVMTSRVAIRAPSPRMMST